MTDSYYNDFISSYNTYKQALLKWVEYHPTVNMYSDTYKEDFRELTILQKVSSEAYKDYLVAKQAYYKHITPGQR